MILRVVLVWKSCSWDRWDESIVFRKVTFRLNDISIYKL